ncbi:MAG TPA: TonB family protein [Candidatus Sulfotelmatobacter sp.]|nr:TonB family protein [Candidatus Sulfotelmatobacter sp.]
MTGRASFHRSHGWFFFLLILTCVLPGRAQDTSRKLLKKVDAQYPSALKQRGIGGTVRLKVYIRADGTVRETEVVGGGAALADAAQKAVAQWRFAPASGESVMEVSVVFNPNS